MSAIFDCDLEFQDEREFYHEESEDDEIEVNSIKITNNEIK